LLEFLPPRRRGEQGLQLLFPLLQRLLRRHQLLPVRRGRWRVGHTSCSTPRLRLGPRIRGERRDEANWPKSQHRATSAIRSTCRAGTYTAYAAFSGPPWVVPCASSSA
jgi:hypothetical protein